MRTIVVFAAVLVGSAPMAAQTSPPSGYQVTPRQLRFTVIANGPLPASQTVVIATSLPPLDLDAILDGGSAGVPAPEGLVVIPRRVLTPARLTVSVTKANLYPGTYSARLVFRTRGTVAALEFFVVPITLTVVERPASLVLTPQGLRFFARPGRLVSEQFVLLTNGGSGGLDCRRVTAAVSEPWLTTGVEAVPDGCRLRVVGSAASLRVGAYVTSIRLTTGIGEASLPVSLFAARSGPLLNLNPKGFQFEARQDNGNAIRRSLSVLNNGEGTLNWTAQVADPKESPWLTITPSSGASTAADPGTVAVTVNPDGLAPGTYYALIQISSPEAANSLRLFPVVLRVAPPSSPPVAAPSPSGLLFTVGAGSGSGTAQTLTIFTSSIAAIPYRAVAQTADGGNWLSVQPTSGTTSTGSPARVTVNVASGQLAPGVYTGEVNTVVLVEGDLQVRSVNVVMVVRPAVRVAAALKDDSPPIHQASCTATRLSAIQTGLVSNFATNVGWPTPLNVRLANDCGDLVPDGQVILSFSNGDPPLALTDLDNGNYAGTWVPRKALEGNTSILVNAFAGSLRATAELTGLVRPNVAPILAPDGILSNRNPRLGGPLAPGMIVEIYGSDLAGGRAEPPLQDGRLPDTFNSVTVQVGAARAPLYFLSPGQINAQIPFELSPDQQYPVVVRSSGALSVAEVISVVSVQPGIAAFPDGRAIAQDESFQLITESNPARRGRFIILYLVGMGATKPVVATGVQSPSATLANVGEAPRVTIDGKEARILFAGLTPGLVGLYQINVEVPEEAAPGMRSVVVAQGSVTGNAVQLPVQ